MSLLVNESGVMIVTSRWPIRQGSRLIPKGTRGRFSTPEEWAKIMPGLHVNRRSWWAAVTFDGFEPMIVAAKEIETTWETERPVKPAS